MSSPRSSVPSKRNRILLITNSELGQANVFLAVAQELLRLRPTLDLHFCSFKPFKNLLSSLKSKDGLGDVLFHELTGTTWKDALFNRPEHRFQELCDRRPTMWNAGEAAAIMPRVACPWNQDELCGLVQQVERIVEDVKADLVIVDNLLAPAVTVCYKLKRKWVVLSPNTYKEFILGNQPWLQALWKFPPPRSTILYPVPLHLIPSTAYQIIRYVLNSRNPWIIGHAKFMIETIQTEYSDWGRISFAPPPGLKILLPSRPEVDFPFSIIPSHIVSCGPIVLPAAPLDKTDPELEIWLTKRPTVYVNLGTHASYNENDLLELAGALKFVLEESKTRGKELQILWKMKKRGDDGDLGHSAVLYALGSEWREFVRITDWLSAEPISILESGAVVCSINHGGANSYFEAISAGIPQVVLPVWFDTYDFAQRVEWLGIGRFGSVKSAPRCSSKELGLILANVLWGDSSVRMRKKAIELAEICKAGGGGRVIAAKEILSELDRTL